MPLVKCRYCNVQFDRALHPEGEFWVKPAVNQYYHTKCWEEKERLLANGLSTKKDDIDYKDLLYQYLHRVLRIDVDFYKFDTQWQNFLKKGMKPKGLYLTARYTYDICKLDISKGFGGIGILEYKYTEACDYWNKRMIEDPDKVQKIIEQTINLQLKETAKAVTRKKREPKKKKIEFLGEDD